MSTKKAGKAAGNSRRKVAIIIVVILVAIILGIIIHSNREKAEEAKIAKAKDDMVTQYKEEMRHVTIGLKGSNPAIVKEGDTYIESGAYAIDDRDGNIQELKAEGSDKVDTSKPGTYKVSYVYKNGEVKDTITRKVKVVAKKDLEDQLAYLKANDYYYPSFKELRAYVDGKISLPKKSIILTFDDGEVRFLKYGTQSLEKYKIPATSFFICVEGKSRIKEFHSPYVCYESHSFDMHRGGGTVGMGGRISAMTKDELKDDLTKAAKFVGSNDALAYPYGDFTDEAREVVRDNGILCAFTTKPGKVYPGMDPTMLPRVRVNRTESLDDFVKSIQ